MQAINDIASQNVSFVFTSYKPLKELAPAVFGTSSLSVFSKIQYIRPASEKDSRIIIDAFKKKYHFECDAETETQLIAIAGGHVRSLQLGLTILHERKQQGKPVPPEQLFETICRDERIQLQFEEIWESFTKAEQEVIRAVALQKPIDEAAITRCEYLLQAQILVQTESGWQLKNRILQNYVQEQHHRQTNHSKFELTKKEQLLYDLLLKHKDEICERGIIVATVWPESNEMGVSDWTIDRLTSRLRSKMKDSHNPHEVVTVRTRGYKLVEK